MIDKHGLYVQADGDGGDCPHRTGIAMTYLAFNDRAKALELFMSARAYLHTADGYIRHPVMWNQPWDFSRDQASRLMLGFAAVGCFGQRLVRQYYSKNKLFHQNKDPWGIGELGFLIRVLNLWYLYPILIVLDLRFIIDIFTRKKWDGASLFIPDIFYAGKVMNTPTRDLAAFIIRKMYKEKITAELMNNHSLEKNGCVELQPMFKWFMGEI